MGLPKRLDRIRSALEVLARHYDAAAAEDFYRAAHSLKGTAPSFGAHELVAPARALAASGRRWFEAGAVTESELTAAFAEIERLAGAVQRFMCENEAGEVE